MKYLLVFTVFVSVALIYELRSNSVMRREYNNYKSRYDSLQFHLDTLRDGVFPLQVELNRYRIAYEIFAERNPKAASQYGDIISNETE